MPRHALALFAAALAFAPAALAGEEPVDLAMMARIRDEGFRHSQVMETAGMLTDVIGPRLTGSPELKRANDWTRDKLAEWGLQNAHLEAWDFGRGWAYSRVSVRMTAPAEVPLPALPRAWTPGTDGPVRGPALRVTAESPADLDAYRGKAAGHVLLIDAPVELKDEDLPKVERYSDAELVGLSSYPVPTAHPDERRQRARKRWEMARAMETFVRDEGALATVEGSRRGDALIEVTGTRGYEADKAPAVPGLMIAAEPYNRLLRLLDRGTDVELEIDDDAHFLDGDGKAYDVLAEIPGSGKEGEVVMAGAHLDSWHAGTGATDNAAGCAVVMEAARILQALGVKPRRTIRVALWTGEEEGLLGSRAYVDAHFGARAEPAEPAQRDLPPYLRDDQGALTLKPEQAKLAAYFNLDNGTGKIRGIYSQENLAVEPIFAAWLAPFHDLGATAVTARDTRGTDHLSFDRVGLPGFQFIQDPLDYETATHHSAADTYDHLRRDDLVQASVVLAAFLYDAATRAERVPRKPLPE
jgi:carboxypeptidase Q